MRHTPLTLILLAGLWLPACGLPDDTLKPITMITDEKQPKNVLQDLARPLLDPLPSAVCAASVPLQGKVKPGASVFVFGGALPSGLTTEGHPATGRFCLDLPLRPGASNTFEVRALDSELGTSEPALATVTQQTCSSEEARIPEQPVATNVALGVWPITSKEASSGDRRYLTDGEPSTVTVYESAWYSAIGNIWISLDLGQLRRIEKVVVRWRDYKGQGKAYASWYKLLSSEEDFPGDPKLQPGCSEYECTAPLVNDNWSDLAEVIDGDGCRGGTCGADVFEVDSQQTTMRHLALWLGLDGGGWGSFAIAEIEVWEAADVVSGQPPVAQPATCANQAPVY